jgi:hypothetical protein
LVSGGNEVKIRITGDATDARRAIGSTMKGVKDLAERTRALAIGMVAVGGAITAAFAMSVKSASSLAEAVNAADVTFGEFSSTIQDFAKTSATSFGISNRAANEYAATLGGILTASGLTQKASADLSVEILTLAADLASVRDMRIEDALRSIRSGLVGEVEPLRRVGVLLNAAAVETKAFKMGLADANSELTEGAKVQARYALIAEQLGEQGVIGDASRTADSFANRQRQLSATIEEAAGAIGVSLIPVLEPLLGLLTDAAAKVSEWATEHPRLTNVLVIGTAALAALSLAAGGFLLILPGLIAGVGALGTAAGVASIGINAMLGPIGLVTLAIGVMGGAFATNMFGMRDAAGSAVGAIGNNFEDLSNSWIDNINKMIRGTNLLAGFFIKIGFMEPFEEMAKMKIPRATEATSALSEELQNTISDLNALKEEGTGAFDAVEVSVSELEERLAAIRANRLGLFFPTGGPTGALGITDALRELEHEMERVTQRIKGNQEAAKGWAVGVTNAAAVASDGIGRFAQNIEEASDTIRGELGSMADSADTLCASVDRCMRAASGATGRPSAYFQNLSGLSGQEMIDAILRGPGGTGGPAQPSPSSNMESGRPAVTNPDLTGAAINVTVNLDGQQITNAVGTAVMDDETTRGS